jgi:hypothetical protein
MIGIQIPDDPRFARVRDELALGRAWKARDRLQGRLRDDPADPVVLDLLGAIWFEMGDLPQAGRYWFLTERDDEPVGRARDAFFERFGQNPLEILRALPPRAEAERYPSIVRARIDELALAAGGGETWWGHSRRRDPWRSVDPATVDAGSNLQWLGLLALVVVVLGCLLIGLATIVGWIIHLVA